MAWVRLDDSIDENEKVARLSDSAVVLWVLALAYCNRHLTDGFIPTRIGRGKVRATDIPVDQAIAELEREGMWVPCEGGWRVHDYLDFQPSREQVEADRERNAKRQQDWRDRQNGRNGVTNGVTNGVSNAPIPSPESRVPKDSQAPKPKDPPDADASAPEGGNETEPPKPARSRPQTRRRRDAQVGTPENPEPTPLQIGQYAEGQGLPDLSGEFLEHYGKVGWVTKAQAPIVCWRRTYSGWCRMAAKIAADRLAAKRQNGSGPAGRNETFAEREHREMIERMAAEGLT